MGPEHLVQRKLVLRGTSEFPTKMYFKMLSVLKDWYGFKVKKYRDWLEVNPRSNYHQDMLQKKQALEQSVSRVMIGLSDMRRDVELIKHDLRRLEEVQSHFKEKDEHVLKSDFVDLVDRNTDQLSLISLATTGKFPTIVVDFYRITDEDDIRKLKVSQTEKGILKKKWRLYRYWKEKYGREIDEKVDMLKGQLNGRRASMKMYKDLLEPYVKAIHKIKFAESGESIFDDPSMIEGYDYSVAGIELYAWKPIFYDKHLEYMKGGKRTARYSGVEEHFFLFLEIKIKRKYGLEEGKRKEKIEIEFIGDLKTGKDIEDIKNKIKERENLMMKELEEFRGGEFKEEPKKSEERKKLIIKLEDMIMGAVGRPVAGDYYLPKGWKDKLEKVGEKIFYDFYDDFKGTFEGLIFKRHQEW